MTGLRLALVTRQFWPRLGGAESLLAGLAAELLAQGARPTIVTARWDAAWPRRLWHRDVPVVRLPQPRARYWGTWRYMAALGGWLRRQRGQVDLVCVSMLKHDAYVAVGQRIALGVPVVLRAEGGGQTGDCAWQRQARCGGRIRARCRRADALVAPSRAIASELEGAGYAAERIHVIANGVQLPEPLAPADRQAARARLLGAALHDPPSLARPLVIYAGRLHPHKGLDDLLAAWPQVLAALPTACLVLVGEGPHRGPLEQRIARSALASSVHLRGALPDAARLLPAADLFVLPSYEEGMSLALLEAMAGELPVVATEIPGNRAVVEHGRHGLLVPPGEPSALAATVAGLLADRDLARRLGQAARQRVREQFLLSQSARRHLELFQRLVRERVPGRS